MRGFYLILLGCWLRMLPLVAQATGPVGAPPDEAHLKGRIWTQTALQIWADRPSLKLKRPDKWNTDQEFKRWAFSEEKNPKDKSGLNALRDRVAKWSQATYQTDRPNAAQLAEGIVHELKQGFDPLRKVQSAALREKLGKLPGLQAQQLNVATAKPTSKPDTSLPNKAASAVEPTIASVPAPALPVAVPATQSYMASPPAPKQVRGYTWPWLVVAGIGGLLLGMLTAIAIRKMLQAQEKPLQPSSPKASTNSVAIPVTNHNSTKEVKESNRKLERENTRLKQENADLRRENERLRLLSNTLSAASDSAASTTEPVPTTAPAAPARFYASATPGGLLEQEKLNLQPMSRMALLVEVSGLQAAFTLSPEVDKSWLIEADLEKLRDYFDFTLPTDRWPSNVAATGAPGTLTRQGDIWQVATKARLDVR